MINRGCFDLILKLGLVVLSPVIAYYLKYEFTTIELFGNRFNTMSILFPIYVIVAVILGYGVTVKRKH
jgi:hypothetical protein